jgi:Outer membrane protein beta-barrel family/Carboxypeptidase regulatory-like domain
MKKILIVTFILNALFLFGQNKGIIKGRAVDSTSQKPVEFASVALLAATDSSIVQGAITDSLGLFTINNLPEGSYIITISSVEYRKVFKGPLVISVSETELDLGNFPLVTDDKALSEFVVRGTKPVFQQRMGTIIVNVDSKMFKTSVNALDVMKRSPGLLVDVSGNIAFRGTSPKILIDGRDLRMSPEQEKNYLRALTPDQIESIELIPNPPAKYEASFATVINIKLKRDQNLGIKGSVYGSYQQHRFSNGELGGNITYKTPKMAYMLNVGASNTNWYQELTDRRVLGATATKDIFESFSFLKTPSKSVNVSGSVEYTVNKTSSIDFKLTGDYNTSPNLTYAETKSTIRNVEQPFLVGTNQMTNISKSITGLLGYRYKTETRELIIEAAAADNRRPGTQDLISQYLINNQSVRGISRQRNDQQANSNFKTLNVTYSDLILDKKWQFETGFKVNYVQNSSRIRFDTLIRSDATPTTPVTDVDFRVDAKRSNSFDFDENINMGFIQMSRQFAKLGFTAGVRVENTVTQGRSETVSSLVDRNYWNWLPTMTFQYKLGESSNLVWASNRKISRPTVWELNPFPFFLDAYTLALGDPFLFPQIRTASELTWTYKSLMLIGGYNHYQNSATQLPLYNDNTRLTTWQQVNIEGQRFFFDISHSAQILPKWNYQVYFSSAYAEEQANINNRNNKNGGLTASIWITNMFTLPKGYNFEVSGYYNVPNQSSLYVSKGNGAINLALQKSFLDNKWNVQLSFNDIFWTSNFRGSILVDNTDLTFTNVQPGRNGSVRITYNFGNSKFQSQGRKSGVGEDAARIKK